MTVRLASLALLSALLSCHPRPTRPDPVTRTLAIGDQLIGDVLEDNVAIAANLQPARARYQRLPDISPAALRAREARLDGWAKELRAIDPQVLAGTPAALTRDLVLTAVEGNVAVRPCRFELWMVSPTFGWQGTLVEALRSQPVDTDDRRAQALARISVEGPRFLAQHTENLREGVKLGYLPAKAALRAVLDQLDGLVSKPAHGSPLASPAERSGVPAFVAQVEAAVDGKLLPALRAHRDFLRDELLPRARDKEGVGNLPDGEACYRGALKRFDNLELDPRELHQVGLAQVEATEVLMRELSQKSFGGVALHELFQRFRTDPRWLFHSREQMLVEARATVERAWTALPRAFNHTPGKKVAVEPFAAFQEKTSAPRYFPASLDGTRPGRFMIRLYDAEKQTRVGSEDLAFHEAVPGHHLQFALVQETPGLPPVSPYTFSGSFAEGWALYAEGLADELHLYSDDAQRLGMLSSRNWRAARIVVDTGLHVLGWERRRAIDYLLAHASLSEDFAAAEVDRYISMPGQATSYMVGFLEITRLRMKAAEQLGERFDVKTFHDRVLEQGIVALPLVSRHVEAWLEQARAP
jgi:uncharacterized protein (DUF885 family)